MRYFTWYLKWDEEGYGHSPVQRASEYGVELMTSGWVIGDVFDGPILGYSHSESELPDLSDWRLTELSESEALDFAANVDPTAFVSESGEIVGAQPSQVPPPESTL